MLVESMKALWYNYGMKKIILLAVAAVAAVPLWACTTVVAGKNATVTGHVILGHNEDDRGNFEVLHGFVPPRTFRPGAKLPAEKGKAEIPQVSKTLGFYWSEVKGSSGSPSFADVFLNEKGVPRALLETIATPFSLRNTSANEGLPDEPLTSLQ